MKTAKAKPERLYVSRFAFGKRAANKLRKTFAEQHGATHLTITAAKHDGMFRVRGRMALTELGHFAANEARSMQVALRDENVMDLRAALTKARG